MAKEKEKTFRSSASFGKRQEYIAVAELLKRGFDVYMTLVDDQQIDCVIRIEKNGKLRYLDVQIKARSKTAKQAATFSAFKINKPRGNYFFIFYSEAANKYWVMPSLDMVKKKLANINKGGPAGKGKNRGKFTIKLANKNKGGWTPRPKFKDYVDAFELLK